MCCFALRRLILQSRALTDELDMWFLSLIVPGECDLQSQNTLLLRSSVPIHPSTTSNLEKISVKIGSQIRESARAQIETLALTFISSSRRTLFKIFGFRLNATSVGTHGALRSSVHVRCHQR